MSVLDRVDRYQRRHRWLGFPLGVIYKFFDDSGVYLASLMAYYAFISLFPLLLLSITILGLVLVGHPQLQESIVNSALSQIPVVGAQLGTPAKLSGGSAAFVIGILGALFGGLGVAQSFQYACNTMWAVPRNSRPNPFIQRGRSVVILAVAGVAVLLISVVSIYTTTQLVAHDRFARLATMSGSMLLTAGLFTLLFRLATGRELTWHQVWPGALVTAAGWQVLQYFGVFFVSRVIANASATNGVFATVLGLIAFLHLSAIWVVFSGEFNVVRAERLWPRALLTPFTDNVDLTPADHKAYALQAKAQRTKGYQQISVVFGERPDPDAHDDDDGEAERDDGAPHRAP